MPVCKCINTNGVRCGIASDYMPFLRFRDSHELKNIELYICQHHYNQVFQVLRNDEESKLALVKTLRRKYSGMGVIQAREKKLTWEKIDHLNDIIKTIKKHKCRFCNHPLNDDDCPQCKERQPDTRKITCVSTFNPNGTMRYNGGFNMHTICGRIWLQAKFGVMCLPSKQGQYTLDQIA